MSGQRGSAIRPCSSVLAGRARSAPDSGQRGELIDRHSEQVQTTLVAWLIRQPTQNTRVTYRAAWQAWCRWCVEHGENWFEPRAGLGAVWLADMERAGLSGSTRRLRMVAVRGAIFELMLEGLSVGGDPFARCRQPKVDDVSATVPLTDLLMMRGARDEAESRLRALLEEHPDSAPARFRFDQLKR